MMPDVEAKNGWAAFWLAGAVMATAFLCFVPALGADFVYWDDDYNLLDNPWYRGLGWEQLSWMWATYHGGHYQPLTWMTFGLDYTLWGMDARGYHLTNVVLHTLSAGLFYAVALRLLGAAGVRSRWGAAAAALLFAIHPLRVESVAWVTERRDVVSGLFYLVSVWAYLRMAAGTRRAAWLGLSLAACGLSLLGKAWAVTLPAVLLVIDVYPLGRWNRTRWRVLAEKALFGLLVVPFVVMAGKAQSAVGAAATLHQLDVPTRISTAIYGLFFYCWKTLLPTGLTALYLRPEPYDPWARQFVLAGVVVLVAGILIAWKARRWPWLAAAAACYVLTVSPVLGIFQSGNQLVADRYSYLACMGWAVLAGAGAAAWGRKRTGRVLVPCATLAVAAVLGVLTWRQTLVWRNTETLWKHAVRVDPSCCVAYNNLGSYFSRRKQMQPAIEYFKRATQLRPDYLDAHTNLGLEYARAGDRGSAVDSFRKALQINSSCLNAHLGSGDAFLKLGDPEQALHHLQEALRLAPGNPLALGLLAEAHRNLANQLAGTGRIDEAIGHYRQVLQLVPGYAEAYNNLGVLLMRKEKAAEAINHFSAAVRIRPDYAEAHNNLGSALAIEGRLDEAISHFSEAVRIKPEYSEAQRNLEEALANRATPR